MTNAQALSNLDAATEPSKTLTRLECCHIQESLTVLARTLAHYDELVRENEELRRAKEEPAPDQPNPNQP